LKVFNFDPADHRDDYAENEWVHIPNGVTPEFLEAMREFVARELTDRKIEGAGIGGKGRKDQAVFEFPAEANAPGEVFDVVAEMCGLNRSTMTLSERHVNAYYEDAPDEPTAHKDRYSSQVSVGLSIESPPGSRVVAYPHDDRGENPFNVSFALVESLPPDRHPDVVLKGAREIELEDNPGDVVAFPGSSTWHLRRQPAGATILYLKMNDFGSDPLGEDPSTPHRRKATMALLASDGASIDDAVAEPARRLDTINRRYLRQGWRDEIEARVWEQPPVPLGELGWRLLAAMDGQRTVRALVGEVAPSDVDSARSTLVELASREVVDLMPASGA
jgi:hypothetical protein